jgi:hypothetical protein
VIRVTSVATFTSDASLGRGYPDQIWEEFSGSQSVGRRPADGRGASQRTPRRRLESFFPAQVCPGVGAGIPPTCAVLSNRAGTALAGRVPEPTLAHFRFDGAPFAS